MDTNEILIASGLIASAIVIYLLSVISQLKDENKAFKTQFDVRLAKAIENFETAERLKMEKMLKEKADFQFNQHKSAWETEIRLDAAKRSRAVIAGLSAENFLPFTDTFIYNPRETRFVGNPIDLIVFDGASDEGREVSIVFIEVKTSKSSLSEKQRRVKEAVEAKRVVWVEIRI